MKKNMLAIALVACSAWDALWAAPSSTTKEIKSQCRLEAMAQGLAGVHVTAYANACIEKRTTPVKDDSGAPRPATEQELEDIRSELQTKLKDADSAKFNSVQVKEKKEGFSTFCGLVNSKNSYGAYAGYSAIVGYFMDMPKRKITSVISMENAMARITCMQYDMRLP